MGAPVAAIRTVDKQQCTECAAFDNLFVRGTSRLCVVCECERARRTAASQGQVLAFVCVVGGGACFFLVMCLMGC